MNISVIFEFMFTFKWYNFQIPFLLFLPFYNICFVFFFPVLALFLVEGWFEDRSFSCLLASKISLCDIFIWVFKWISCVNLLSQRLHANGLIPKWTSTCLSSFEGVGNVLRQMEQVLDFFKQPVLFLISTLWVSICLFIWPSCVNLFSQTLHENGFIPVQVNLFQNHLFLHQLTHNKTKDCSLIYKFRTWGEHVV